MCNRRLVIASPSPIRIRLLPYSLELATRFVRYSRRALPRFRLWPQQRRRPLPPRPQRRCSTHGRTAGGVRAWAPAHLLLRACWRRRSLSSRRSSSAARQKRRSSLGLQLQRGRHSGLACRRRGRDRGYALLWPQTSKLFGFHLLATCVVILLPTLLSAYIWFRCDKHRRHYCSS